MDKGSVAPQFRVCCVFIGCYNLSEVLPAVQSRTVTVSAEVSAA
jgi:hypothetical protein